MDAFVELAGAGIDRAMFLSDTESGLRAVLVIDSLHLGPAVGGIRTRAYPSFQHALADARKLAKAMTLKCAIAGLDAGGAKTVVLDHPGLNREAAFRRLGEYIEELRGLYWAAGDLGTTARDLEIAASATHYVNGDVGTLAQATGQTVVNGIRACIWIRGKEDLRDTRVAIQGCGAIGSGVARALAAAGASLVVSDLIQEQAHALAEETGAAVLPPHEILGADVDIVSPCGAGGTVTRRAVEAMKAWAICGGANNQLEDADDTAWALAEAGIHYVPDFLASAGGVTAGVARRIMDRDPEPLLAATFETAKLILEEARRSKSPSSEIARNLACRRLEVGAGQEPFG